MNAMERRETAEGVIPNILVLGESGTRNELIARVRSNVDPIVELLAELALRPRADTFRRLINKYQIRG
jgi:hypothetical protein